MLTLVGYATPAFSETATQADPTTYLRPDLAPRIECGDVMGTAWPAGQHLLVTAYHVTREGKVACYLPTTGEKAYILAEDSNADIAYLYVAKPRAWHYAISCDPYVKGEDYYGAGWPIEGFTIAHVRASGERALMTGYWWGQYLFRGPQYFEHGQSGGPVIDRLGYVHGLVNGGTDDKVFSTSRALADTALCKAQ